jgi:hypothetical protein
MDNRWTRPKPKLRLNVVIAKRTALQLIEIINDLIFMPDHWRTARACVSDSRA